MLAIASTIPLLLLVAKNPADAATSGPVLVVVAHPDDEALQMSGVMANAKIAGRPVYLAVLTNGDAGGALPAGGSYCGAAPGAPSDAAALALIRDQESRNAMGVSSIGITWTNSVATSRIFFLGYPDSRLQDVANNSSTTSITNGTTGLTRTFARSGNGSTSDPCNGDFSFLLRAAHSPLTAAALADDMDDLLDLVKPTDIYTHSTFEGHTDHREAARQVTAAAIRSHLNTTVHGTLIHPEGSDSCSQQSYYMWPNPEGNATSNSDLRATPTSEFTTPPGPLCTGAPNWGPNGAPPEKLTVPTSMQNSPLASNGKWAIISKYTSQHGCGPDPFNPTCGFLKGFVKLKEIFWPQTYGVGTPLPYKDTVLASPQLAGYWRLGESSGTTAAAVTGTNATHHGATVGVAGLLTGDSDKAASFAGNNGSTVGDVYDFAGHAQFTLEAWVKPANLTAVQRIFSKEGSDANGDQGYSLTNGSMSNGQPGLEFSRLNNASDLVNPGGYYSLQAPALPAGQIHHVAVTEDGSVMRMFVDGEQVASAPDKHALVDTGSAFTIGAKAGGGLGAFSGTIDEPAVYNTALTAASIKSHFLSGKGIAGPPDAIKPAKPATPTATAGNGSVTIGLSPLNTESDLASYTLERKKSTDAESAWTGVKTGITTWPVTDSGLSNGTTYQYRVLANDVSGNKSDPSSAVSATPVGPVIVTPTTTVTPITPVTPVTPASPKDTLAPKLKVTIAKRIAKSSALGSKGLRITLSCSEACSYRAQLTMDGVTARKLGISRVLKTVKGKLTKAGKKTLVIKLSKKVRSRLKRLSKTTVTIKTRATDTAGNATARTVKTVLR